MQSNPLMPFIRRLNFIIVTDSCLFIILCLLLIIKNHIFERYEIFLNTHAWTSNIEKKLYHNVVEKYRWDVPE